MSGQPYRTQADIMDFRQDYLNSLMAQVQLNDANLKANQVYISTGQLPARSAMPDTRTTTEKLADVARLRVNLINDMRSIADANVSAQFVQSIERSPINANGALFTFMAQNIGEIVAGIKKKYKYGIKGDTDDVQKFTSFVENAYTTAKGITGSVKSSFNRPQSNKAGSMADLNNIKIELSKIGAIIQADYHSIFQPIVKIILNKISEFIKLAPSMEAMEKLRTTFSENTVALQSGYNEDQGFDSHHISRVYAGIDYYLRTELPNVPAIWTLLDSIKDQSNNLGGYVSKTFKQNVYDSISELLPESHTNANLHQMINKTFQFFIDYENHLEKVKQEEWEQGPIGLDDEPSAITTTADAVVKTLSLLGLITGAVGALTLAVSGAQMSAYNGIAQIEQSYNASNYQPSLDQYNSGISYGGFQPLNPYAPDNTYNYFDKLQPLPLDNSTSIPQFKYTWEDGSIHDTPEPIEEPPDLIPDEITPDMLKMFKDDEIFRRQLIANPQANAEDRKRGYAEREKIQAKWRSDYPDFSWESTKQMAIDEGHDVSPIGHGLKRGRGRPKGSGIAHPFKEKVDLSRGIEPDRRFVKFGRFLINTNKLHDDVVAIKRPSGSNITEFPSQRVSTHLSNVFKKIIGGGVPSFNELSSLNDTERNYLYNVSKKAEIADKLSIPTPSKDQKDKEIHDYEVAKGEILSGNDNREFIKKFKLMVVKLSKSGVLPKKEANEVLSDLVELGF